MGPTAMERKRAAMGNATADKAAANIALVRGRALGVMLSALAWSGCSLDGLLKSDQLPPDITDPAITKTPAGALAAYRGTVALFQSAFGGTGNSFIEVGGKLSDELYSTGQVDASATTPDLRILSDLNPETGSTYSQLQKVRGQAGQAIGLLSAYVPEQPARAGELYALQGYAEVFLADLFCSGIPLSTLDYNGDYTYQPGSNTDEVYTHAGRLFDSALTLAGQNDTITRLARVGQARALLARGQYNAAAAAVESVPDDYRYVVSFAAITNTSGSNAMSFARTDDGTLSSRWGISVGDREGLRGMDYVTSSDPRTPVVEGSGQGTTYFHPSQYAPDGSGSIVLASGVEARLIEAEAAIQVGDPAWLTKLNALRTDGTFTVDSQAIVNNAVSPPDTTGWTYDTLWHAGTGGIPGLAPLTDPGSDSAHVALLFHERAFWLFLTGHRQGDLRRLLRQYSKYWPTQDRVYPTGQYQGSIYEYGSDVAARVPAAEGVSNPLFTGCRSTGP